MRLVNRDFRRGWVGIVLALALVSTSAHAEHTRITNPNAVSLELLGRGMLYSIDYDRVVNDDIVAGFGYGSVPTKVTLGTTDFDTNINANQIPIYLNYYFQRDAGSLYVTGGATLIMNSSDVKGFKTNTGNLELPDSSVLPTFGLGYENRGDTGFLMRVTGYGIVGKKLAPWVGFTFGYAF